MNQPFRAFTRPSTWSDARAAGVCFLAVCGRVSAVLSAIAVVHACRLLVVSSEVTS